MIDINGMKINIKESWYNKSQVQEDGITHIIDTETKYPMYQVEIFKTYFDIDSRKEAVKAIIEDLSKVLENLTELESPYNTRDGR